MRKVNLPPKEKGYNFPKELAKTGSTCEIKSNPLQVTLHTDTYTVDSTSHQPQQSSSMATEDFTSSSPPLHFLGHAPLTTNYLHLCLIISISRNIYIPHVYTHGLWNVVCITFIAKLCLHNILEETHATIGKTCKTTNRQLPELRIKTMPPYQSLYSEDLYLLLVKQQANANDRMAKRCILGWTLMSVDSTCCISLITVLPIALMSWPNQQINLSLLITVNTSK